MIYDSIVNSMTKGAGARMEKQYRELANAIARQAESLALGKIPEGQRYAHMRLLLNNVNTLMAWTPDDRG